LLMISNLQRHTQFRVNCRYNTEILWIVEFGIHCHKIPR
jgi:hypothetical protein